MDWVPADLLDGLLADARETLSQAGVQLPEPGSADAAETPRDCDPWARVLAGASPCLACAPPLTRRARATEEVTGLERALMLVLAAGS